MRRFLGAFHDSRFGGCRAHVGVRATTVPAGVPPADEETSRLPWSARGKMPRSPAATMAVATGGFTLVELVISAALMSVILAAGYVCLSAGLSSRAMVEARADLLQNARVALGRLTADLRAACPLAEEYEFLGMSRVVDGREADNLDFATHHYTPRRAGESDVCEVSYFLEKHPETGRFSLWRRLDTFPDEEPLAGGSREEIIPGMEGLRFEYYDGLEWFDEWGDPSGRRRGAEGDSLLVPNNLSGLPEAVRVTLFLADSSWPSRAASSVEETDPPPLVFQTVARLNLALISAERSAAGRGSSSSSSSSSGTLKRGGGG